jgi:SPP1 gp7 family putative phage head morphogenesis protein
VISDNDLSDRFDLVVQRNVRLIQHLSDGLYLRVEGSVSQAAINGTTAKALSKELTEQFGFTQRRARLIARDQIAKVTSNLNRMRQQQAGIDSYVWSTSLDERVRGNPSGKYSHAVPSHWAREGKTYRWDDPPSGGHPGDPVNCRCTARAKIEI